MKKKFKPVKKKPEPGDFRLYSEADLLPVSALQHLLFCERQCALIHIEQVWADNRFTAEGHILHRKTHEQGHETRRGVRTVRALAIRSLRLGLTGVADVVEFGTQAVRPVEYKRGKPKKDFSDSVQLCAQAMCLEEMLKCGIPSGDLFYGKPRRRKTVVFDTAMRRKTEEAAERLHELIRRGVTPPPFITKGCDLCSLSEYCMPHVVEDGRCVSDYLKRVI